MVCVGSWSFVKAKGKWLIQILVYSGSESVNSQWIPHSLEVCFRGCLFGFTLRSVYFNFTCMRLCLYVSIPRVCLVLREARRRYEIPGVGISLVLVWILFSCLFVCFLRLDLMYPRLTMKFWSSCLHLPRAHDRWAPQPGILRVSQWFCLCLHCLFSVFCFWVWEYVVVCFGSPPVSIPLFHNWDYRVAPGALTGITMWLR